MSTLLPTSHTGVLTSVENHWHLYCNFLTLSLLSTQHLIGVHIQWIKNRATGFFSIYLKQMLCSFMGITNDGNLLSLIVTL